MLPERGMAAERTTLAWRRTGMALFVCGVAIMRGVPTRNGVPGRPVVGAIVLVLGTVPVLISTRQAAVRSRTLGTARPSARLSDLAPLALGVALVGVAAFVVALLR
jgi:uncharacterized membrane protein YidH (DUF202 family)